MPVVIEKGLPASPEAERSVLGGIILENGLIHETSASLLAEDFYRDCHRRIFSAMVELASESKPIDPLTISEVLAKRKELQAIGGSAYLSDLTTGVAKRQALGHYITLIREKSNLRRLITIGQQITAQALENDATAEDLIGKAQELLLTVAGEATKQHAKPASDFMGRTLAELDRQRRSGSQLLGLSTGTPGLDNMTGGIREGEMWVIGALPGRGKTAIGTQIAANTASRGVPTLIFELEMTDTQVGRRLLPNQANIPATKIRNPNFLTDSDWLQVDATVGEMRQWPLWVDDASELTTRQLASRARLYIRRHKVRLIVVDYLMLVDDPEEKEVRHKARKIANTLRRVAKDETKAGHPVSVILLSQIRRTEGLNQKPTMIHLKESGDIEAAANVVVLIHMPVDESQKPTGEDELIIGKQRDGNIGSIPVVYSKTRLIFQDRF